MVHSTQSWTAQPRNKRRPNPAQKNGLLEGLEISGWVGPGHSELVHKVLRVGVLLYSSTRYLVTTEWHGTAHLGFSGASGQAIFSARTGLGWGRCAFYVPGQCRTWTGRGGPPIPTTLIITTKRHYCPRLCWFPVGNCLKVLQFKKQKTLKL